MSNEVIEIKSLRIGNLLIYNGDLIHVTSLSLDIDDEYEETIGFCKYGETSNEHGGWNRSLCLDLSPIQLTPEWLERLGFTKDDDEVDQKTGRTVEGRWRHEGYLEWPGLYYLPDYELKHLHQLQNLYFALTGEELPIKVSSQPK